MNLVVIAGLLAVAGLPWVALRQVTAGAQVPVSMEDVRTLCVAQRALFLKATTRERTLRSGRSVVADFVLDNQGDRPVVISGDLVWSVDSTPTVGKGSVLPSRSVVRRVLQPGDCIRGSLLVTILASGRYGLHCQVDVLGRPDVPLESPWLRYDYPLLDVGP